MKDCIDLHVDLGNVGSHIGWNRPNGGGLLHFLLESSLNILSVKSGHARAYRCSIEISARNKRQRLGCRLVVPDILCYILQVVAGLSELDMVKYWTVLEVSIANNHGLVRQDVPEEAEHPLLFFLKFRKTWVHFRQLAKVDKFRVNEHPLIRLVADRNRMVLDFGTKSVVKNIDTVAIDHVEAKLLQLFIVELFYLVNLLQTNQTGLARGNLFNDARPAELKVAHLFGGVGEVVLMAKTSG